MAIMGRDLPLNIGQKITATIRGEKYTIALRGWAVKKYIITDIPSMPGEAFRVAPQTGCTINYMREGVFINFKTQIIYALAQAASLMVLEYPNKFDLHNLRDNERYRVNFPFEYSVNINGTSFTDNGTIRDLSIKGMLFCHKKDLTKDDPISITMDFPEGKVENLNGVIKNIRKNPRSESEPFVTGVSFTELSETQYEILGGFLKGRANERRKGSRT